MSTHSTDVLSSAHNRGRRCRVSLGTPCPGSDASRRRSETPLFKISLAEWSFHRALQAGKMDNLDFPKVAKQDFDIDCVEYVNRSSRTRPRTRSTRRNSSSAATTSAYRAASSCATTRATSAIPATPSARKAVENHYKWVEAAKFLGCHSIRVNARSSGDPKEQHKHAVDGLRRLSEFGAKHDMNVIVENHGGISSNGEWLAGVIKESSIGLKNCGTLPDFGNFKISPTENIRPLQRRRRNDALRQRRQRQKPRLRRRGQRDRDRLPQNDENRPRRRLPRLRRHRIRRASRPASPRASN